LTELGEISIAAYCSPAELFCPEHTLCISYGETSLFNSKRAKDSVVGYLNVVMNLKSIKGINP
jgi:hypothetical protein